MINAWTRLDDLYSFHGAEKVDRCNPQIRDLEVCTSLVTGYTVRISQDGDVISITHNDSLRGSGSTLFCAWSDFKSKIDVRTNEFKLSDNQKKRMKQLRKYLSEVKEVERSDFDTWFAGKKTVCVNIEAYLILIEGDE